MHFVAATPWHLSPTQDHWMHTAFCCCFTSTWLYTKLLFTQNSIITAGSHKFLMSADCMSLLCRLAGLHCNLPSAQLPEHLCLVQLQHWLLTQNTFYVCQHSCYNHCYTATKQSIQLKSLLLLQHLFLYLHVCCWWIFWSQNYWFDGVLLMLMSSLLADNNTEVVSWLFTAVCRHVGHCS